MRLQSREMLYLDTNEMLVLPSTVGEPADQVIPEHHLEQPLLATEHNQSERSSLQEKRTSHCSSDTRINIDMNGLEAGIASYCIVSYCVVGYLYC